MNRSSSDSVCVKCFENVLPQTELSKQTRQTVIEAVCAEEMLLLKAVIKAVILTSASFPFRFFYETSNGMIMFRK